VAAVRLLLCAVVTHPVGLLLLQLLHGVAFGGWWVAMVEVARRRAPAGVRASVQAVAGSAAYGVGPLLCQAAAAAVLDRGGVPALFAIASLFAIAGGVVARTVREIPDALATTPDRVVA
jgi:MFS family permease